MKSVISKSVLLGVALAAITGCSTSGDKSSSESNLGSTELAVQIANGNGLTISSVGYSFVGPQSYTGNITAPQNSKKISGRVGNIKPGNYNVILTGHPDGHGEINCKGEVDGLTVQAGKAAKANVSIVCEEHITGDAGHATDGMIDVNATAELTTVIDGVCPIFLNDSASALEIPADGTTSISLTGAASTVSPAATLVWSAPSGTVVNGTNGAATFTCASSTTGSVVRVSLTITGNNPIVACTPVVEFVDIECSVGSTSTSTSISTGGTSTGGTSAVGGTSAATGGTSAATGGTSAVTGGTSAVGGTSATGGSSTDPIAAILTAYVSGQPSADQCTPSCATGCTRFESTTTAFLNLLACIMPTGGYQAGGSCYDYNGTNTAISCYCGLTDTQTCTTTGGIGQCAAQETAAGMLPGNVINGFTDTTVEAGKVNAFTNCLSTTCGCFW